MSKQQLIRLIQESRSALDTATVEQKVRLLKLIKESIQSLKNVSVKKIQLSENSDYLEEK